MLKVLVPFAVLKLPEGSGSPPLNLVRETYSKKLIAHNLLPLYISPVMTEAMIDEIYNQVSGACFIGGFDFDPKRYGQSPHEKIKPIEPTRDELELRLMNRILKDRKPFLGLCRGSQVLAIASDGNLHQHIDDLYPNEHHNAETYDRLYTFPKHPVIIDQSSRFYSIIGSTEVMVNTGHHQAIDNPGKNLTIVGRSPAGVAEAIEHTDPNYFCFGVQSHPEAEEESFFEPLFQAFAQAVQAYHSQT